jgi:uncharacterized protein involved in type VI secretion and phage assembly
VEFPWQKDKNKTTNWIRVATPDAGKSDKVPQNRGFVFIPEKDDLVMVDFEYGDPNRPYVSGTIFSERVSKGGGDVNHLRSITDKSNNFIQLNSLEGIKIQDKGKDFIHEDGAGNITIQSYNTIRLICNDGKGGEGSKMIMDKDGSIEVSGSVIRINALKNILAISGEKMLLWAKKIINMISEKLNISASEETQVTGGGGSIVEKDGFVDIN